MRVDVTQGKAIPVINKEDEVLKSIEATYPGLGVGSFIVSVWQELQDYNPSGERHNILGKLLQLFSAEWMFHVITDDHSGGYIVEIPWNLELERELTPSEVTAILVRGKGGKDKQRTRRRGNGSNR